MVSIAEKICKTVQETGNRVAYDPRFIAAVVANEKEFLEDPTINLGDEANLAIMEALYEVSGEEGKTVSPADMRAMRELGFFGDVARCAVKSEPKAGSRFFRLNDDARTRIVTRDNTEAGTVENFVRVARLLHEGQEETCVSMGEHILGVLETDPAERARFNPQPAEFVDRWICGGWPVSSMPQSDYDAFVRDTVSYVHDQLAAE